MWGIKFVPRLRERDKEKERSGGEGAAEGSSRLEGSMLSFLTAGILSFIT